MFFWNSLAFSMIQQMLAIWSLVPLPFLNSAWTSGSSRFMYSWSLAWRILSTTLLMCVYFCPYGRKWGGTKKPLDESQRGEWKSGLKLNIQGTKIMASGPITSWEIDGETVETVSEFIFWGSKITVDGDCSHEIKRLSLEGKLCPT